LAGALLFDEKIKKFFAVQTEFLKSVVECALMSVGLEHREANASVMKFFYDLFRAGRTREHDPDFEVSARYSVFRSGF
jgi:hypothetical protein